MGIEFDKLLKVVYAKWKAKLPVDKTGHPHEESLSAFVENSLSSREEKEAIKKHLLTCDKCAQIVAFSIKLESVPGIEPPAALLETSRDLINKAISGQTLEIMVRIRERLLELINTSGDVLMGQELVPAAVLRSRKISDFKDEVTILKDFGDIRIEVKIASQENGNFYLQIIIKDKLSQEVKKDLRVSLIQGDIELESYISEAGKVIFEHVPLGKYTVEIFNLQDKIAGILLDIKV